MLKATYSREQLGAILADIDNIVYKSPAADALRCRSVCFDQLGCFDNCKGVLNHIDKLPDHPDDISVVFTLYARWWFEVVLCILSHSVWRFVESFLVRIRRSFAIPRGRLLGLPAQILTQTFLTWNDRVPSGWLDTLCRSCPPLEMIVVLDV